MNWIRGFSKNDYNSDMEQEVSQNNLNSLQYFRILLNSFSNIFELF